MRQDKVFLSNSLEWSVICIYPDVQRVVGIRIRVQLQIEPSPFTVNSLSTDETWRQHHAMGILFFSRGKDAEVNRGQSQRKTWWFPHSRCLTHNLATIGKGEFRDHPFYIFICKKLEIIAHVYTNYLHFLIET